MKSQQPKPAHESHYPPLKNQRTLIMLLPIIMGGLIFLLLFTSLQPTAAQEDVYLGNNDISLNNLSPYTLSQNHMVPPAIIPQTTGIADGSIQRLGENSEYSDISADGRYAVFSSENGVARYDLETGASEVIAAGIDASYVAISSDGRFIAYVSPSAGNNTHVFLYDDATGVAENISISLGSSTQNSEPSVADDGSVGFTSRVIAATGTENVYFYDNNANTLVHIDPAIPNSADDKVLDDMSATGEYFLIGVGSALFFYDHNVESFSSIDPPNGYYEVGAPAKFSTDAEGRYIVYEAYKLTCQQLFCHYDAYIFLYDRQTDTTDGIKYLEGGSPYNAANDYIIVGVSQNGQYVFYRTVGNTNHISVYDRVEDSITVITERINGELNNSINNFNVSGDGQYIVFNSADSNFILDDNNNASDAFLTKLSDQTPTIYPGQDWNVECPFCSVADSQQYVNGINPRTGNFVYSEGFLHTSIAWGTLGFDYSYISEATDMYTTTMGYGWAHTYEMSLHFDSTALTHTVILQAPGGSRFPYDGNGDGTYTRYAGVTADLVRTDGTNPEDTTYEVTTFNQYKARFDYLGRLTEQEDPHGNVVAFSYASFNGTQRLYQAYQGSRYLEYDYDANGRLYTVTDNNNRIVTLAYDGNGDLASAAAPGTASKT